MPDPTPAPALTVTFASAEALPETIGEPDQPLIVMPFIDADLARRSAQQLARRANAVGRLLCVHDVKRAGFVAVANSAFRRSVAPQFGYVAQDAFAGRGWLGFALAKLAEKDGGLLAFNDGKWGGALAAFGLVERGWAASNYGGDLFFPGYDRHYGDVELTLIAMQQGKLRFEPISILLEVDWNKEMTSVSEQDRLLYYRRSQTAFDGKVTHPSLRRMFK